MKNFWRIINLLIGCCLVAIGCNLFVLPNQLLTFDTLGIACLLNYINNVPVGINVLLLNLIIILLAYLVLDKKVVRAFLLPAILIPLFLILTIKIKNFVPLDIEEMMLNVIVAGFLIGYGCSLLYKNGYSAGSIFLIDEVLGKITHFHTRIYSWVIDIVIIIIAIPLFGYQMALYSLVIIMICRYMITKTRFGISESKMFYIITSKEKEVKHFIIHDLKYELTVLDVKGGFTKRKNQILLAVIATPDYYRVKEGIKIIDPQAFITITDTYDVVNRHNMKEIK